MNPLKIIDRETGKIEVEEIYGGKAISFLYGPSFLGKVLKELSAKLSFFSALFGWVMKGKRSAKKVDPFIKKFDVDLSGFEVPKEGFASFNDFFIRKLKPRKISSSDFICPADGRYLFIPNIKKAEGFYVKGEKFNLQTLLQDNELASHYEGGSLVIARLCPTDYHRFHFPAAGVPSTPRWINGWLYSVNPYALKQDIGIFSKNKRVITRLETSFGECLLLEVGATNVGSIHETFTPLKSVSKGEEKGFFEFGASALILLFKKGTLILDQDLRDLSQKNLEIKCSFGQSLGRGIYENSKSRFN